MKRRNHFQRAMRDASSKYAGLDRLGEPSGIAKAPDVSGIRQEKSLFPTCQRRTWRLWRHRIDAPLFQDRHLVVAKRFEQFGVPQETQWNLVGPRFHVGFWIVNGDCQFHVAEVRTSPPLGDMQGVTMRVGLKGAEPTAIAESHGVHNKRIAIPRANRVPKPRRFRFADLRQGPSVREDLTENHTDVGFMQECSEWRRLKDLERAASVDAWHAERQAVPVWIVDVIAVHTLFSNGGRPWRQLDLTGLQLPRQIVEVEHVPDIPYT